MGSIQGNATWYDLCYGGAHSTGSHGACGECYDNADNFAWPNLTTTGCNDHCGTNPPLACGDSVDIWDMCQENSHAIGYAEDCCPCASQEGCNRGYTCYGSTTSSTSIYQRPLIDLTSGFFVYLHGNLADGRIPVTIFY